MAISMIPKLSKIINEHKEYHLEIFDEFKSKMIKVVVLFTLSYVFIFCQYLFMPLLEICVESCKRCNREEKSVNYYSSPVRNTTIQIQEIIIIIIKIILDQLLQEIILIQKERKLKYVYLIQILIQIIV